MVTKHSYLNIDVVACKVTYATRGMNMTSETISAIGRVFWASNLASSTTTKPSISVDTWVTMLFTVLVYRSICPK